MSWPQQVSVPPPALVMITSTPHLLHIYRLPIWFGIHRPFHPLPYPPPLQGRAGRGLPSLKLRIPFLMERSNPLRPVGRRVQQKTEVSLQACPFGEGKIDALTHGFLTIADR